MRTFLLLAVALPLIAATGCAAQPLSSNGKSDYVIVVGDSADAPERTAAKELQTYLRQVTGADFPIQTEAEAEESAPAIFVGRTKRGDALAGSVDWARLGTDGILMKTAGPNLILAGGKPRGTLYAVYTFLEDSVGCRWWTSSESSIPQKRTLTIPPLSTVYVPKLQIREAYERDVNTSPDFAVRLKVNGHWTNIPPEYGGHRPTLGWCHTFYQLLPPDKYFAQHPEWYSEINGKRVGQAAQLCLTNEAGRKALTAAALEWLRKDPTADVISISQNDAGGYCQCPNCRAVEQSEGSPAGPLLRYVNAVADDIHREFPNVQVETLAYQWSRKAPLHVRPASNVTIRLCSFECDFAHPLDSDYNKDFRQDVLDWSRIAPRLAVWDYVTDFANYLLPFPDLKNLAPNIRFFVANNAQSVFEQGDAFTRAGDFVRLRAWLLAHLLWDPSRDPTQLTADFLNGYYGAAGPYLKQYLDVVNDSAMRGPTRVLCFQSNLEFLSAADLVQASRLFDQAQQAVANDPALLRRVTRERLPLENAILVRYEGVKQAWAASGAGTRALPSQQELADAFFRRVHALKVDSIGESQSLASYEAGIRSHLGSASAAPPPPGVAGLPPGSWRDVQESGFTLFGGPTAASIVDDPKASDGKAVRMPGGRQEWATQLVISRDLADALPGSWHAFAVVRSQPLQQSGLAFTIGVFDNQKNAAVAQQTIGLDRAGDGAYHTYDLGTWQFHQGMYIWVSPPGNAQAEEGVYVDRIYFVKAR